MVRYLSAMLYKALETHRFCVYPSWAGSDESCKYDKYQEAVPTCHVVTRLWLDSWLRRRSGVKVDGSIAADKRIQTMALWKTLQGLSAT